MVYVMSIPLDNGCARTPGVPSVPGNDKRLITLSCSYRSFDTVTFILTGDLATGGFNRSTVVVVQDVVRKVFWVVFFCHYNTTYAYFRDFEFYFKQRYYI